MKTYAGGRAKSRKRCTHPCKCGKAGDAESCTCTPREIQQYRSRISGPLLDRIDIHIEVPAVKYRDLADRAESSAEITRRVERARGIQLERFKGAPATGGGDGEARLLGSGLYPHPQGGQDHCRP